ncbi:hypothetical protein D3C73_1145230 [compost metagenome]
MRIAFTQNWGQLLAQSFRQLYEGVAAIADVIDYQPVHAWAWFEVDVYASTSDLAGSSVTVFKATDHMRTANEAGQFQRLLHRASIGSNEDGVGPRTGVGFVTTSHGLGNNLW